MCKGTVQTGLSVFTADLDGCVVIIRNVPSGICSQCGEVSYPDNVTRCLERIVQNIKDSSATGIAVVGYSEKKLIRQPARVEAVSFY
jgi:YgiT-type zinc finger domain-containing protein